MLRRVAPARPGTWTAISRPPWFTALAVWPKGDSWGGGGLFVSRSSTSCSSTTSGIHYGVDQFQLMEDFTLPRRFRVQSYATPCAGARTAISSSAAWCCPAGASCSAPSGDARPADRRWAFRSSGRRSWRARSMIAKRPRFELRRFVDGYAPGRAQGDSRIMRAEIHDLKPRRHRDLGRVDWVDADHEGDVLWSARGKLFRLAGPARRGMKHRRRAEARRRSQRHDVRGDRGAAARDEVAVGLARRWVISRRFRAIVWRN